MHRDYQAFLSLLKLLLFFALAFCLAVSSCIVDRAVLLIVDQYLVLVTSLSSNRAELQVLHEASGACQLTIVQYHHHHRSAARGRVYVRLRLGAQSGEQAVSARLSVL